MADEEAKRRAQRLREEIARITGKTPPSQNDKDAPKKSPHELVEERMRELERERDKKDP